MKYTENQEGDASLFDLIFNNKTRLRKKARELLESAKSQVENLIGKRK